MTSENDTSKTGEEKLTEFESTRGLRYVEIFTVGQEWMTVYNTTDVDEAPPEVWDAFDAEAAAKEMGVGMVLKNGPHWWAFDGATLRFGVDVVTVGGINFRTAARLPAFLAKEGKLEPPFYTVVEANKEACRCVFQFLNVF